MVQTTDTEEERWKRNSSSNREKKQQTNKKSINLIQNAAKRKRAYLMLYVLAYLASI